MTDNGKSVVLAPLDRSPNFGVEMDCGTPVLDMSPDAMVFPFDGARPGRGRRRRAPIAGAPRGTRPPRTSRATA